MRSGIHETPHALCQKLTVEVDQQADTLAARSKVREHLRLKQGLHPLNAFDLHQYLARNHQVDPVIANPLFPIVDRDVNLALECQAGTPKLDAQRSFVRFLQKTWTNSLVHPNRGANDLLREGVELRGHTGGQSKKWSATTRPRLYKQLSRKRAEPLPGRTLDKQLALPCRLTG